MEKINDIRRHDWDELVEEVKTFSLQHRIIVSDMLDTIIVRGRDTTPSTNTNLVHTPKLQSSSKSQISVVLQ